MVILKEKKFTTMGNTYGFLIPKVLVDCEILLRSKRYNVIIEEVPLEKDNILLENPLYTFRFGTPELSRETPKFKPFSQLLIISKTGHYFDLKKKGV